MTDWGAIIGTLGVIVGVIIGVYGWRRQDKRDRMEEGGSRGELRSDIAYIKRRTDDTLLEVKETNKCFTALSERVTRVEESAKSAHRRIDELIEK